MQLRQYALLCKCCILYNIIDDNVYDTRISLKKTLTKHIYSFGTFNNTLLYVAGLSSKRHTNSNFYNQILCVEGE